MLTTILFDAGGTLVFPSFRRIADEIGAARPGRPEVDIAALARADAQVRFALDRPEIIAATNDETRFRRYLRLIGEAAGVGDIPEPAIARLESYHDVHNLWEDVPSDVPPALAALRGRVRLGVVSNANGTVRAKLERVGLATYFETIVDSHEEGIEKPDPRLFAIALARMNVRADDTAYVGDLFHVDVVGAQAAGLRAFLLDPHDLYGHVSTERVRTLAALIDLVTRA